MSLAALNPIAVMFTGCRPLSWVVVCCLVVTRGRGSTGNDPFAPLAAADSFPFLFNVGGAGMDGVLPALQKVVPRVIFDQIFECPHPCGLLPLFDPTTNTTINGGIPQQANLTLHLETLNATFSRYVALNDSRWIDLDFESWSPVWARISNTSYYYNASVALVRLKHPSWTKGQLEAEAGIQYQAAAIRLIVETVQFVRYVLVGTLSRRGYTLSAAVVADAN